MATEETTHAPPKPEYTTGLGGIPLGPISFGISIVSAILSAILGFGGSGDVKKLAQQVQQFEQAAAAALDELKRFAWTVARALGGLLQAFHDALAFLLEAIWSEVKKIVTALGRLITEGIAKLGQAVRKIHDLMRSIYRDYIRNVLNWIQKARRYLAILRALHVPLAGKLDNILAGIEARIIAPYLYVLRSLNGVGGWLNVILTAKAVLQRAVFLRSLWLYQTDLVNLWWGSQAGAGGKGGTSDSSPTPAPATLAEVQAGFSLFVQADSGEYALDAAKALAAARTEV